MPEPDACVSINQILWARLITGTAWLGQMNDGLENRFLTRLPRPAEYTFPFYHHHQGPGRRIYNSGSLTI